MDQERFVSVLNIFKRITRLHVCGSPQRALEKKKKSWSSVIKKSIKNTFFQIVSSYHFSLLSFGANPISILASSSII